jgi:hypothetical protein
VEALGSSNERKEKVDGFCQATLLFRCQIQNNHFHEMSDRNNFYFHVTSTGKIGICILSKEIIKIAIFPQIQSVPIVQTGPFHVFFVNGKTVWAD